MYFYYYDSWLTTGLLILGFVICIFAQIKISSTYAKYKKIRSSSEKTGEDVAVAILNKNGLNDITVNAIAGNLTDHYSPGRKEINLSEDVYGGISIASLAIAAHECGHAIQKKENYAFYNMRTALVPVVNAINYIGYFGILISLFAGYFQYVKVAIFVVLATLVFQLITLPVEFDASSRALKQIEELGIVSHDEKNKCRGMLTAAALTYVAAVAAALMQVLRLLLIIAQSNRDDN